MQRLFFSGVESDRRNIKGSPQKGQHKISHNSEKFGDSCR